MTKKSKIMLLTLMLIVAGVFVSCGGGEGQEQGNEYGDIEAGWSPQSVMIDFEQYQILRVSDRPLFNAGGGVNQDVLDNLMAILNDPRLDPMLREPKSEWPGALPFNDMPYTAITAADFSDFVVPSPVSMSHSGAIVIKLFEAIPARAGVHNGHLTEFTSQWWQLVYRAADDGNDVLTLWMMQPYRLTPFGGTRYDNVAGNVPDRFIDRLRNPEYGVWSRILPGGINTVLSDERIALGLPPCDNYFFEGNFSAGIARSNLLRDMEAVLNEFGVEAYLVAPRNLPGGWQNSAYQTGANMNMEYFVTGQFYRSNGDRGFVGSHNFHDGLGATGLIWGTHRHFALINGKDGLSVGPYYGHWPNTTLAPTHDDLFWLPSDFEVRTMGFDKDNALFQTFITDADDRASILRTNTEPENRPDNANGRSGLWRLNGFDRAFDIDGLGLPRGWMTELVWLRSHDSLGLGNANTISNTGNRYGYGVNQLAGMRPALHLSITQLSQN
jgi:hypothetical protein